MFVYALVSVIWLLIAVINFVVLCSRKTPFTAMDIYLIKDAIKVIPLYINIFQMIIIIAGVAVVVAALVMEEIRKMYSTAFREKVLYSSII